jgi:hypothetical protein
MRIYISGQSSVLELENLKQIHSEEGISIVAYHCNDTLKRIELLVNCEAIYFVTGWQDCIYSHIEMSIAEITDIEIRYQDENRYGL